MAATLRLHAIDFEKLTTLALVALYERYLRSADRYADITELYSIVSYGSINALRDVLDDLTRKGLVRRESKKVPVKTTRGGFANLEEKIEYVDEPLNSFRLSLRGAQEVCSLGQSTLDDFAAQLRVPEDETESTTRSGAASWEPLPIDRSSAEFQKVVSETEIAIQRIEADNGYATSAPQERDGIVATMKGTLSALKAGWVSKEIIVFGLIRPLKFIVDKFAGAGLAEAGKRALEFLLGFFH